MTNTTPPYEVRRRCARLHHASSLCDACVKACPAQALKIVDEKVVLVAPRCTGCGACSAACPSEVFVFTAPDDAALFKSLFTASREKPAITIVCTDAGKVRADITLSCLLRLEAGHFATAAAAGATDVTLFHADCADCPKKGAANLAHLVSDARALLAALGSSLAITEKTNASRVNADRRFFLTRLTRQAAPQGDERKPDVAQKIEAAAEAEPWQHVPAKRLRTTAALRLLLERAEKNAEHPDYPVKLPEIGATCEGCGFCAMTCPTLALKTETSADVMRFSVTPADCTACGVCVDLCYKNAVTMVEAPLRRSLSAEPRVLFEKKVAGGLFTDSFEDKMAAEFGDVPIYRT